MFGDVSKFTDAAYFDAHPTGSLSLPGAGYSIEFFACLEADAYDAVLYTPDAPDLQPLLDYAAAHAVQQRDIGVTAQDKLAALSTCAGAETNGRIVLLGRLRPITEGDEMQ